MKKLNHGGGKPGIKNEMSVLEDVLEKRNKCMNDEADRKIFEEYLLSIDCMEKAFMDIKYTLLLETNVIEMANPDIIYPDYYLQKKGMLEELALYYYQEEMKAEIGEKRKRIAICTNTWREKGYSIGVVIATLANEFFKQGYDVTIFVENQYEHDDRIKDILYPDLLIDARDFDSEHKSMLARGIEIQYGSGRSIGEKVVNHINHIFQYSPMFVLDITDENSCCSRILYEKIPVLYFPMRSNHGTSMFFHKYLAVNPKKMQQINAVYHSFDDRLIEPIEAGITDFPVAKTTYSKEEEFGQDGFVLVTVGNRLVHDCDKEFIDFAIKVLRSNPEFLWVFVGGDVPELLMRERKKFHLQRRIVIRGYEQDLIALYHICDVYVNPMRKGGGLSIIWAMHEGVPIAMVRYLSDGLIWLGEENAVDGGYEELQKYIGLLKKDQDFYKRKQSEMRMRAKQNTPENCVGQLLKIYEKVKRRL